MFKKILIANRGEIACRIMRTCRRMEIRTVAVYSDVDEALPHVTMADEAYCIGIAPSRESYLNIERLIEVALKSGAEAIHPGYGFLSEKAAFAQAVEAAGLVFIGPSAQTIRLMGDKIEAKNLAAQAGVYLVPGTSEPMSNVQEALDFAHQHQGPLLLKAAAGGGGKGMRVVHSLDDLPLAYERVKSEALSSFGDDRIFIEKYIANPHHIEIQILGDRFGHIIHLGERDCSLQRRHQKVVEESPSPFITDELRQKMVAQALQLARASGYTSAGTVEFIVSPEGDFYFLEMNTRLQVEHPVTESTYGIDLVEWMIRIAAGEPFPFQQEELVPQGHAVEVRLYAEDPDQNFLPSAGRLVQFYTVPHPLIRFDAGYEEGDCLSIYYDPMIAKVIAWAPSRQEALEGLSHFLSSMVLDGVTSNQDFLIRLLNHPCVVAGDYHTHFIQDCLSDLSQQEDVSQQLYNLPTIDSIPENGQHLFLVAGLLIAKSFYKENVAALSCLSGDKVFNFAISGNRIFDKAGAGKGADCLEGSQEYAYDFKWLYQRRVFELTLNDDIHVGRCSVIHTGYVITLKGRSVFMDVMRSNVWPMLKLLPKKKIKKDIKSVKAPMPGTLINMPIHVGQKIKKGQPLMIIEAMKMENVLKSPVEGTIAEICVKEGDNLMRDQVIARFV